MVGRRGRVAAALVALVALVVTACTSGDRTAGPSGDAAVTEVTHVTAVTEAAGDAGSDPPASSSGSATGDATGGWPALPGLLDPSDAPIANDAAVRTGTLPNGLTYYVRENDNPGMEADLRLVVRAGSVDESGASTGVAHFVEHMMFNGTERYPENQLTDVLRGFGAQFGADVNAATTFDETVYSLTVPNRDDALDAGLSVLSEWLSHATFDEQQVVAERGVVLDEWRQSTQSTGGRLFAVAAGMYLDGTPYAGRDPIGDQRSIEAMGRDELVAFYDRWYRPDNAAIVVVGDVDAGEIVDEIEQRFGPAAPRTVEPLAAPDVTFPLDATPRFALHADPDQSSVDVEVTLPLPAEPFGTRRGGTAARRAALLDRMIFDILIRRLDRDVSDGTAPFDDVTLGTNSFVESLDAPALYAFTDADRAGATLQALLDEYERAARFGFSATEVDVARSTQQAASDSRYDGRDSTQDVEYAEQYVEHFLRGVPYPAIGDEHGAVTEVLAGVTAEALDLRFRARWGHSAPHVIVSAPAADSGRVPSAGDVLAMVAGLPSRDLSRRDAARPLPDELMAAPEEVEPTSVEALGDGDAPDVHGDPYLQPVEAVFPNGVRVIVTSNEIVAGQVTFQAASPGGSSLVADADVVDALYAPDVVTSSGVAGFAQSELSELLADHDVSVGAWLTPYTENLGGTVAAADLETLFQLLHLYMGEPRFDPVALRQVQRANEPLVDDPGSDRDLAASDALLDARYGGGDLRHAVLPTPEQFATLDLDGVERVWRDRFGDPSDWVFVLAGDVDVDRVVELAGRYLATLPGTGATERWIDLDRPAPAGVVREVVHAGTGDSSSATLLFTSPVPAVDGALRATADVVDEVVNTRLTDVVRERLGESYSPFAVTSISSDPGPVIETYVQVTGSPDRVEAVGDLVAAELADLAASGPTGRELDGALAVVGERYGFVSNDSYVTELLNDAVWPGRPLDGYLDQPRRLATVDAEAVRRFVAAHLPATSYVQVTVLPR